MSKILRTPTSAMGGLTNKEKKQMETHAQVWIDRILYTGHIQPDKITPAIEGLYKVSGLAKPRVVIVPSPMVMALAGGIATAVWHLRKKSNGKSSSISPARATYAATYLATTAAAAATYLATTAAATAAATYVATDHAIDTATDADTIKNYDWLKPLIISFVGEQNFDFAMECIRNWGKMRQGGNMWASWDCYLTACRDILGLTGLDCWDKYQHWEQAAIYGGFRLMHEEFCMVSDFPEILKIDGQKRPHNEVGPSHRWRDGFEIYALHGVQMPKEMWQTIMTGKMTFSEILKIENTEQRLMAMRYNPHALMLLNPKLVSKTNRDNELYLLENTEVNKIYEAPKVWILRFRDPSKIPPNNWMIKRVDPALCALTEDADEVMAFTYYGQLEENQTPTKEKIAIYAALYAQLKNEG